MNDEDLVHIIEDIDFFLNATSIKHKVAFLPLTGIILARLAVVAKQLNGTDEFLLLLNTAKSSIMDSSSQEKVVH